MMALGFGLWALGSRSKAKSPKPMSGPPAAALSAFYEGVLQSALRQFFRRASLEIEPGGAVRADRPLSIDAATDPSTLHISWSGTVYTLRMPGRSTFTPRSEEHTSELQSH